MNQHDLGENPTGNNDVAPTEESIRIASEGRFCNNCGAPLAPDAKFCIECGTPVTPETQDQASGPKEQQESAPQGSSEASTQVFPAVSSSADSVPPQIPLQQVAAKVKKPLPKHFKLIMWLTGGAVILLWALISAGYFFFNYFGNSADGFSFYWTHQSSSLTRYVEDYNSQARLGDQNLEWYVWSDTKEPVKSSDIKYKPTLPAKINETTLLPGTQMEEVGKKFLIFPDYKVVVTPQKLDLSANSENLAVSVNSTDVGTSDSTHFSTSVAHLFPGTYKVSASGTVKKVDVSIAQKIAATKGTTRAAFNLEFITFHLYSNVSDGDVYVGTSLIGKLKGGDYKFNDIPVLSGQDLRVQKAFKDGIVKTSSTKVDDISDGDSVQLDWDQELTTDTASNMLDNAESVLSSYASTGDIDSQISDVFAGGQSNGVFKHFKTGIDKNLKSTDNPTGMKASYVDFDNFNVTKIKQTGVNRYEVHFSMRWDFYYSNDTSYGDYYETDSYVVAVEYKPAGNTEDSGEASGSDASNFIISDLVSGPSDTSVDNQIETF
ncbi:MAG: zinc-ribbon domain-containing protein [Bifidobacteriaceae bacterium]|jgi:uncharacterized membrane protein YvbJ|nr:zinc-ribbon domain-containing protein [Bifidobacteriaceae bacterium]MCI1915461.1 zinc-ribbon domain-containing protein [Bifidobacteriaceae bacterium]